HNAMALAIRTGKEKYVEALSDLLKHDPNMIPLQEAALEGQFESVKQRLTQGANPATLDAKDQSVFEYAVREPENTCLAVLHRAPAFCKPEMLSKLFLAAALFNNVKALRATLLAGVNFYSTNRTGHNALHLTAAR